MYVCVYGPYRSATVTVHLYVLVHVGLLTLYCDMYFSSIASLDKTLVAKVIQTLLSHSSTQVDIPLHGLYIFYSKAFSKIRSKGWGASGEVGLS